MKPPSTSSPDSPVPGLLTARQCLLVYFVLGFAAMLTQTVLIREFLVVFYGNELCLGLILAGWLWWISAGAGVGSRRAGKAANPALAFAWWLALAAAAPVGQILAIRLVRVWVGAPTGQYVPLTTMLVAAFIVLFPFSFVVGYTFPLGLRLWRAGSGAATQIGQIYLVEAAGSLTGGVLFTFVLVRFFSSPACALLSAVLLAGLGSTLVRTAAAPPLSKRLAGAVLVGAVLVAVGGLGLNRVTTIARWQSVGTQEAAAVKTLPVFGRVRRRVHRLHAALTGSLAPADSAVGTFIRSVDSPYQNIVLSEANGQYNVFFNGQYSFCFPDVRTYSLTAVPVLAQHPYPRDVLLIDNGNIEMAEAMLRTCVRRLDYVQLDPMVLAALQPELKSPAFHDPRLHLLHTDGRRYVRTTRRRYDLVFVHVGDPSTTVTNRYYTREFFTEVRRRLRPGGVLAFTLSSNETYFGETLGDYSATIFHTLKQVFPSLLVDSGETALYFGATADGVLSGDQEELVNRARRWLKPGEFPPPEILYSLFLPGRSKFAYEQIAGRKPERLNTDLLPAAYLDYLLLWDRQVEGRFYQVFRYLRAQKAGRVIGVAVAVALLWTGLLALVQPRERRRVPVYLLAVSATGFSAMGLEVVLLLAFQTALGYLYQWVGLIVATFMLGLAGGAFGVTRILTRPRNHRRLLLSVHLALLAFALLIPLLLPVVSAATLATVGWLIPLAFILLMVFAGLLTGAQLPLAAALCLATDLEPTHVAGIVDRADHFGGFVGALFGGAVLLPVIGVAGTCWLLAAMNALVIGLLFAQRGSGAPALRP